MAKRKKKPSAHQHHKLARAQHRNEFLRKVKFIVNEFSGENLFASLPKEELDFIYQFRMRSLKVMAADGADVPNVVLDIVKWALTETMKKEKFKISEKLPEMTLDDCFLVGVTVSAYVSILVEKRFSASHRIVEGMKGFPSLEEIVNFINDIIFNRLMTIGLYISLPLRDMYWLEIVSSETGYVKDGVQNTLLLHVQKQETIQVTVNGKTRPVTRLGLSLPNTGIEWSMLRASDLNFDGPFGGLQLPVYFQAHSLNRFFERVDCIDQRSLILTMHVSFKEAKIIKAPDKKLLLEYRFEAVKLGYFRIDIIDGIIVIRTFLFLTNNGTPEGEMLEKMTGMQKLDKKYLTIDKLSTFIASDLGKVPHIKNLLIESGCGSLIDLRENMKNVVSPVKKNDLTEKLKNYISPLYPELASAV